MLKVFLVEDETVIREGLRDRIPWEQYGYRFVGEAADGEVALPLIRKTRPDVLITDIKMPFMDGCHSAGLCGRNSRRQRYSLSAVMMILNMREKQFPLAWISIS